MDIAPTGSRSKSLTVFSLVMINVIAVDSLRTLPIAAEYGFALIFFYLLGAVCFFIPAALVTAELATTWPKTGGLYIWVREAFGRRWGLLAIWLHWLTNVVWYPTIMAFIAATLAYLIDPSLAERQGFLVLVVNVCFWLATLANFYGMKVSSLVSTIGALFGVLLPMLVLIGLGSYWIFTGHPQQITWDWPHFFPDFHHTANLVFFVGILFGLMGIEMSAIHAGDVKNPQRDYPRALLYSTLIILGSLMLASLTIALVIPPKKLSLISGLLEAFRIFFNAYHMPAMTTLIAITIIVGSLSSVSAWTLGPIKGVMIALKEGGQWPALTQTNAHHAPTRLLVLQGVIVSLLSTLFLLMPTLNASYWLLSALTAQLALLYYLLIFGSAIALRYSHPDIVRPFRISKGNVGLCCVAGLGFFTCLLAIGLGFFPPLQFDVGSVTFYETFLILGILTCCLPPLWIGRKR